MDNLDYPCICGHVAGEHVMDKKCVFKYCLIKMEYSLDCQCNDFTPDNLRYLEIQNDKQHAS